MKTIVLSLSLSLSALVFAGCASRSMPRPADTEPGAPVREPVKVKVIKELAGSSWVLAELDGRAVPTPPEGWLARSLSFDANGLRVTGHAGVNGFGGRYSQHGSELSFGPLALTRRAGPPELMDAESRYTQVLSRVVGWRQDGENLVLLTPGVDRAAVFVRAEDSQSE